MLLQIVLFCATVRGLEEAQTESRKYSELETIRINTFPQITGNSRYLQPIAPANIGYSSPTRRKANCMKRVEEKKEEKTEVPDAASNGTTTNEKSLSSPPKVVNYDPPPITAKKLILFAVPRTGSNYFCELLIRHPSIVMHAELFHPDYMANPDETYRGISIPTAVVQNRTINPELYLKWIWSQSVDKEMVGFKIFPNHVSEEHLRKHFLEGNRDAKKVILYRSNLLATHVSEQISFQIGQWTRVNTSNMKVNVIPRKFNRLENTTLTWYRTIISELRRTNQDYFTVEYDSDMLGIENTKKMFTKLQSFLEIEDVDLFDCPTLHVKQAQIPLKSQILNWNNLSQHILNYSLKKYKLNEFIQLIPFEDEKYSLSQKIDMSYNNSNYNNNKVNLNSCNSIAFNGMESKLRILFDDVNASLLSIRKLKSKENLFSTIILYSGPVHYFVETCPQHLYKFDLIVYSDFEYYYNAWKSFRVIQTPPLSMLIDNDENANLLQIFRDNLKWYLWMKKNQLQYMLPSFYEPKNATFPCILLFQVRNSNGMLTTKPMRISGAAQLQFVLNRLPPKTNYMIKEVIRSTDGKDIWIYGSSLKGKLLSLTCFERPLSDKYDNTWKKRSLGGTFSSVSDSSASSSRALAVADNSRDGKVAHAGRVTSSSTSSSANYIKMIQCSRQDMLVSRYEHYMRCFDINIVFVVKIECEKSRRKSTLYWSISYSRDLAPWKDDISQYDSRPWEASSDARGLVPTNIIFIICGNLWF